jgi:hypothetical protein
MLQWVGKKSIDVNNVLFESPRAVAFPFKLFLVHVAELFQVDGPY